MADPQTDRNQEVGVVIRQLQHAVNAEESDAQQADNRLDGVHPLRSVQIPRDDQQGERKSQRIAAPKHQFQEQVVRVLPHQAQRWMVLCDRKLSTGGLHPTHPRPGRLGQRIEEHHPCLQATRVEAARTERCRGIEQQGGLQHGPPVGKQPVNHGHGKNRSKLNLKLHTTPARNEQPDQDGRTKQHGRARLGGRGPQKQQYEHTGAHPSPEAPLLSKQQQSEHAQAQKGTEVIGLGKVGTSSATGAQPKTPESKIADPQPLKERNNGRKRAAKQNRSGQQGRRARGVTSSPAVPCQDCNGHRQYIETTNHSVSAEGEPTCDPVKPRNAGDRDSDPEDGWHAGL